MSSTKRVFLGVALTLLTVATGFSQYQPSSRPTNSDRPSDGQRNGYSYVRETVGGVTVQSRWNGRVTARRNMPISAGDEILVSEAGRAEIGLADGNLLFVGGGTRARFTSLNDQQGENDDFSAIDLRDGSVVLATTGADEKSVPRIDTEDATVYLSASSRVRVNADPRRGTVVVVRAGSAEVRTRLDSYTVDAGQYLMVQGDETPDISRGVFSRDRFDLWCADRLEGLSDETARSASVRYVDEDYASDVVALDDYGDWEYNSTYSTNVWVPRVSIGWTPYSSGTWYYTPIGLTWWSWDPWGWYPFHYGSWFFDVGFHHWCWAPSYVYSPAWVYWGYTPGYVGWCPVGYYSFFSPWFDNYYRSWGWTGGYSRARNLVFALSGTFKTSKVDLGGWNFAASRSLGTTSDRLAVVPGTRIASTLGDQIAISAKPIVVSSRGESVSQAIQNYVKEAPALIERTKSRDATRLAPVLAREKSLPPSTLDALRERAVVTGRGQLGGPGADELASRGTIVERGRSVTEFLGSRGGAEKLGGDKGSAFARGRKAGVAPIVSGETAREAPATAGPRSEDVWRGRGREIGRAPAPDVSGIERGDKGRGRPETVAPREGRATDRSEPAPPAQDWRQRAPDLKREAPPPPDRPGRAPDEIERRKPGKSVSREETWRGRPESRRVAPVPEPRSSEPGWRSRSEVPPARRVIEGAVPGRRWQAETESAPHGRQSLGGADWRQRSPERVAPAPREYRLPPREYGAPPAREYRPEPREFRAPAPREYREPPRVERAPQSSAPSAPASGSKGHGKGHKG
ncbi:MAG TPA: DUF6600 domain-containing protein [Thermoanaerobaculia bacterium]